MARQNDRRKLAEWQQRLRRLEKAGLTVARFCTRERAAVPTFWYLRRKCADDAPSPRSAPTVFCRVEVVGSSAVTLRVATGAVMELPDDRLDLVRAVVEAAAGSPKPC
jgi:hypothetical protein